MFVKHLESGSTTNAVELLDFGERVCGQVFVFPCSRAPGQTLSQSCHLPGARWN